MLLTLFLRTFLQKIGNTSDYVKVNTQVRIIPSPAVATAVGEQFTVNINIIDGINVFGFQVTVDFDPSALKYVESSNGDYLPEGAFFAAPETDIEFHY